MTSERAIVVLDVVAVVSMALGLVLFGVGLGLWWA